MSEQKVAIITGAGSGIGAATAKRLAKDGHKVVLNGRTESKLEKIAGDIGEDAHVHAGDVSKPDDVDHLIQTTIDKFGRLDVLINNAGVAEFGAIGDMDYEIFQTIQSINVGGPFLMIKAALPHLEKTKGAIVNTSSVSGLGGDWGGVAYNASKGALTLMTQALALDFAQKEVRVNAVAPSFTKTDMTSAITDNQELLNAFKQRIAMGRGAEPEEVADVIAFLAGSDARFVTGVTIPVDGGLSASNGQPKIG